MILFLPLFRLNRITKEENDKPLTRRGDVFIMREWITKWKTRQKSIEKRAEIQMFLKWYRNSQISPHELEQF